MRIVICGLSITSSWGNGHATTYRSLVQGLCRRGHRVLFLERDKPWYAGNRDMPHSLFGEVELYDSIDGLDRRFTSEVANADFVMLGSFVPEGTRVAEWIFDRARRLVAFYDIDTPVTLSKLENHDAEYLRRDLIPRFDLYLSFTGGPTLRRLESDYGAKCALPLYCSVDPTVYFPCRTPARWDLGYLGTYSDDRQPALDRLLLTPASVAKESRFVVAGSLYPPHLTWPGNVERIEHLAPRRHCEFYNSQRFTLNITRRQMIEAGYSPSIRIFEAAACAVPIVSDYWMGLEDILEPGKEVLIAHDSQDVLDFMGKLSSSEAQLIGKRARGRILAEHTAGCRSLQLENYIARLRGKEQKVYASSWEG